MTDAGTGQFLLLACTHTRRVRLLTDASAGKLALLAGTNAREIRRPAGWVSGHGRGR